MIEPRMMRVLVALGGAGDRVLSRDDLIERCWDGVIVSDNAINRVISRLRHVLDDLGGGAVRLETIPKTGFRLVVELPVAGARPTLASTGNGMPIAAVLPIALRNGSRDFAMLAEDLTEEITRELAQGSLFKVLSTGTMAAWRDSAIDHRSLGRELEVSYLIEGKLQHDGDEIRLSVQLVETATGSVLHSALRTRSLSEIAATPEALPVAIACEFGESINRAEADRAMAKQEPLSGWDHTVRAVAFLERITQDSIRCGLEEARKAVAIAPDIGLAHALIARMIPLDPAIWPQKPDDALRRKIHDHIGNAMQLDGNNPVVLLYAVGAYIGLGDPEAALRLARRAVELNPNSPRSQFALGQAFQVMDRTSDAIAAYREQLRLAPHDLNRPQALTMLGVCLCIENRPGEADEALDRALALHPEFHIALMFKSVVAAQQGREQATRDAVMKLREASPGITIDLHARNMTALLRDHSAGPVAILRRLWEATEAGTQPEP